jgi:methionyl-tRNA formyltransferase
MAYEILFMGTPEFSVPILKSLNSKHKILSVFTQPPKKKSRGQKILKSPIHLEAERLNLPVRFPDSLNNNLDYEFIKESNVKFVIVVAYGQIIPENFLNIKDVIFLNIHASLLPRWRGAAPIQRSIIEMDKETGVSIMKIIPKLDAGPYMLQKSVIIEKKRYFHIIKQ